MDGTSQPLGRNFFAVGWYNEELIMKQRVKLKRRFRLKRMF
jgi:hypothetical protein